MAIKVGISLKRDEFPITWIHRKLAEKWVAQGKAVWLIKGRRIFCEEGLRWKKEHDRATYIKGMILGTNQGTVYERCAADSERSGFLGGLTRTEHKPRRSKKLK